MTDFQNAVGVAASYLLGSANYSLAQRLEPADRWIALAKVLKEDAK